MTSSTLTPQSIAQARRYPVSSKWTVDHALEPSALHKQSATKWIALYSTILIWKPASMTKYHEYKQDLMANIVPCEVCCPQHMDLMIPYVQYDRQDTAAYFADQFTTRLLLAIAVQFCLPLGHLDISSASTHKLYQLNKTVYVWQLPKIRSQKAQRNKPIAYLHHNFMDLVQNERTTTRR